MSDLKYIAINPQSDQTSERDLRSDVGDFAYVDHGTIAAPFDVTELPIGSSRYDGETWDDVENPPSQLPTGGHFQVKVVDGLKTVYYVVSIQDAVTDACFSTRSASLVIKNGVAEQWKYFAQGDTQDFGKIGVASEYDQGKATRLDHKVYSADFIDENASLDRGSRSGKINFDKLILPGDYDINWGAGSKHTPPTTSNRGRLKVGGTGCVVWQEYYPYGNGELLYRERSEQRVWESWEVTLVGQTRQDKKVKVPARWHRGRPSGFEWVETYDANTIDTKATYKAGYAIDISADNTISWTGTIGGGVETDPTVPTHVKGITSTQISNWDTAFGWGSHSGIYPLLSGSYNNPSWINSLAWSKITGVPDFGATYAPLSRSLTIGGSAGRVAVSGGTQSLLADRTWTVDLASVHTGLSGGSSTQVAAPTVDAYGRVTSMTSIPIAFPVTGVSGGVLSLSAGIISLLPNAYDSRYSLIGHTHSYADLSGKPTTIAGFGITDVYTKTESDGRFVALAGSYANPSWITSLDYAKITNTPDFAGLYVPIVRQLTVSGTTGRVAVTGGTQNLAASRTWSVDLAAVHTGLSGGSAITTPSLNVDAYGRVTSMTYSTILFPVTSVNSKTGAVVLNTDDVAEGTTNQYWKNERGDARYVSLTGSYTNPSWLVSFPYSKLTGVPSFLTQAYTTVQADTLPITQRNNLNFSPEFSVADSSANNRTTVGISAVPFAKISGVPAFLTSETDPTVPSHVKTILASDISGWNAKVAGSGTVNYVAKFTATGTVGNSTIFDNGNVSIGTNDPAGYKLRVAGAIYADGDASAVAMYVPSGRAIRAQGTMNIDAGTAAPIYFRSGGGASYIMELNSSGQIRFNSYYSATQWSGTAAALLGTDSSGNVITLPTVRTNSENDARYAPISHTQAISTITGLQAALDAKANAIHGHNIGDVTGLQNALDAKADWGHNHDDRYYTKSQLNTSGAGGIVHWNNLIGIPGLSYDGHNHDDRYYTESEVNTFLSGKADWGHNHDDRYYTEAEVNSLLSSKADWGHNHDDRYYTESESDARYLQAENDPHGFGSQWYSRSGYTVTHGIQKRNGEQYYASFTIPEPLGYDIATQTLLNGSHLIRLNRNDGWYIDRTITETDPYGVSSAYGSYSSGNLSLTIVLRNGAQVTCNIPFSGPS